MGGYYYRLKRPNLLSKLGCTLVTIAVATVSLSVGLLLKGSDAAVTNESVDCCDDECFFFV